MSKFDDANKITYAFFDTGLEFRATKEHIEYWKIDTIFILNVLKR